MISVSQGPSRLLGFHCGSRPSGKRARILLNSVLASCGLALASATSVAMAQSAPLPSRIIMIVPFPPAGSIDWMGRTIADQLQKRTGSAVIADNRPGGGGVVGMTALAR